MTRDVFLNGIGIVNKTGFSIDDVREKPRVYGEITDFKFEDFIDSQKSYLDRSGEFSLVAANMALNDAGYSVTESINWDFGIITASTWGATETLSKYEKMIVKRGAKGANSILFTHLYMNSPVSILSIDFRLGGHHLCYGGENSAQHAIFMAYNAVSSGRAEHMMVVCYDVLPKNYGYFSEIREGATAFIFSANEKGIHVKEDRINCLTKNIIGGELCFETANDFLLSF